MSILTHKFTVMQYHQMAEVGILNPQDRVELIQGEIIQMSPIGLKHAITVNYVGNFFPRQLGEKVIVSVQNPIQLNDHSEPQPDIVLLKPRSDFYRSFNATLADILLIIEVSDSTLKYDQETKVPLYAENQIPEVWLVNLIHQTLEVYRQSWQKTYQHQQCLTLGEKISPLAFPELIVDLNQVFGKFN